MLSVVVADDVADLRVLLRLGLDVAGGFEVVGEAGDGRQAVEVVGRTRPAALLLDLSMPVLDGLAAIPEVKEASPATKIVVLSGFETEAMAADCLAAGAHAYLQKGVTPGAIADTLRRVCGEEAPPAPATTPAAHDLGSAGVDLLSVAAHDLRTPVTAIVGAAETLLAQDGSLSPELRRTLIEMVARQGRRLNRLVEDLSTSVRLAEDRLPARRQPLALDPVVAGSVAVSIAKDVEVGGVAGTWVEGDADRIEQVLVNLLGNAHRHGRPPVTVTVMRPGPDRVEVLVADGGGGIGDDVAARLFERYATTTGATSGIGLGLYIARGVARSMGGELEHRAGPGPTTFALTLRPAEPVDGEVATPS